MIVGISHSRAPKSIFKHNDLEMLEQLLQTSVDAGNKPCIVFESVYSMDGDKGLISDVCEIARVRGAMVYVDEVHAVLVRVLGLLKRLLAGLDLYLLLFTHGQLPQWLKEVFLL